MKPFVVIHQFILEPFKAKEESFADTGYEEPRIVVLTDFSILVFEPDQNQTPERAYSVLNLCIDLKMIRRLEKKISVAGVLLLSWESKEQEV